MKQMKTRTVLAMASIASALAGVIQVAVAQEREGLYFDISIYGLAAAQTGDVTVRGVDADLNLGFDDIVENLELSAMGAVRVGWNRWALRGEVVYMGLGASKGGVNADADQWVVEPTVSYKVCRHFEAFAGARYNNLAVEISGPFGRVPSGTQDWWDPIVGAAVSLPLTSHFSFDLRGDVGGFSAGSDLTWQVFPYLNWRFADWGSMQAGYRLLSVDYEDGSGTGEFRYDVLTHGAQLGVTIHL
jgi:hypothetical protein